MKTLLTLLLFLSAAASGQDAQKEINEQAVIAQLDKVLSLEQDIKRTQLILLIRLKNKLTPQQQAQLRQFKAKQQEK